MTISENMKIGIRIILFFLLLSLPTLIVSANEANILNVGIKNEGNDRYTFNVTVQHEGKGWDHYADRWEILTPEGEIVAIRVLRHPHIKEQPFARNLPFVPVSKDINEVTIRAHCSVDEFGGKEIMLKIPR